MTTHSIEWVNNGEPFEVARGCVTPEGLRRAHLARAHEVQRGLKALKKDGIDLNEFTPDLRREEETRIKQDAETAFMEAYIYEFLCGVDPSLRERLTKAEAREKLTDEDTLQLLALFASFGVNQKKRIEEAVRPLVRPTTSDESTT